jgi:transposase, IS30 family
MGCVGRPGIRVEVQRRFWSRLRDGAALAAAAEAVGVSDKTAMGWFRQAGGVIPSIVEPGPARLSYLEREEIACRHAAKQGVREIARDLQRDPSTISRELRRGVVRARTGYRASVAQAGADARAARPKPAKLAGNDRLREQVQNRLQRKHSPAQVAYRLRVDFPDDPEMWVSAETIYQSLYVQGRGGLRRDLHTCLRTGRALRKPRRTSAEARGKIADMVNIADRPAEVEDRAVPGHWEGDLIIGKDSGSAIGTLVERITGFTMLLHLPDTHGAAQVAQAMVTSISQLPTQLRKTLTWDQGKEMTNHIQIAAATDLAIYFCDPHSPWQRGTNENTNGLLRQYFPKGTDLSGYHPDYLDYVAAELNSRPRKRLGWKTPAEALDELLSEPFKPPSVALAG